MASNEQSVSNRLSREKGTNITYNNMLERSGPLNKKNKHFSRDIFTLALAFGYMENIRLSLDSKDNFINSENFGDNLPSLINALAISKSKEGIQILAEDTSKIYEVAEEYANGGLALLDSEYVGKEDQFIEKLRLIILKYNKNDRILKEIDEMNL